MQLLVPFLSCEKLPGVLSAPGLFHGGGVTDDNGWYSITLSDDERPDVNLKAGGFPDTLTALWFVEQLEEWMAFLISQVDHDSEVIDLRTHRGNNTIN